MYMCINDTKIIYLSKSKVEIENENSDHLP